MRTLSLGQLGSLTLLGACARWTQIFPYGLPTDIMARLAGLLSLIIAAARLTLRRFQHGIRRDAHRPPLTYLHTHAFAP